MLNEAILKRLSTLDGCPTPPLSLYEIEQWLKDMGRGEERRKSIRDLLRHAAEDWMSAYDRALCVAVLDAEKEQKAA